jgi:hypothetical protein
MNIEYSIEISKPANVVFPWIANPLKAVQWQSNIKSYEIIKQTDDLVGSTFKEYLEEDGSTLEIFGSVLDKVENKRISFQVKSKYHKLNVCYSLFEDKGITCVSISGNILWKFPINIIIALKSKKVKKEMSIQMREELLKLKRLCEE